MNQNQTESKPPSVEESADKGLDGTPCCVSLSVSERQQLAEILDRRSNEIASFKRDLEHKLARTIDEFPGSVELAMTREIARLRKLADKLRPPSPDDDDEE